MNQDLDKLLKKLEEERKKTFTSLQKELESWKKNYESLLSSIETSLENDYYRIKEKLNQIDELIKSELSRAERETQQELQGLIERKKSEWLGAIQKSIVELERELSSMQVVKPAFRLTVKVWKWTLLMVLPIGFILGAIGGAIVGKKLGETLGQKEYQEKLAEVEKLERNFKTLRPEWVKEWRIQILRDKQGSFPCLMSKAAVEIEGKKLMLLDDAEGYCIPLDPLHQRHIEP